MSAALQLLTPEVKALAKQADYDFTRRAPGVMLPYQQRWIADKSQVKVQEKSRRVGLSWAEAADSALEAAASSGQDVWYIGYNKDMAIEFILDVAQWAVHFNEVADAIECGEEVFKDGDEDKAVRVVRKAMRRESTRQLVPTPLPTDELGLGKAFMELAEGKDISDRHLAWLVGIHLVFVISGVLLALMDWLASKTDKH